MKLTARSRYSLMAAVFADFNFASYQEDMDQAMGLTDEVRNQLADWRDLV